MSGRNGGCSKHELANQTWSEKTAELLEALQAICADDNYRQPKELHEKIQIAIAKATGIGLECPPHRSLYSHSAPPREWVGLTDEERRACTQSPFAWENFLAIEAKLKEKNT